MEFCLHNGLPNEVILPLLKHVREQLARIEANVRRCAYQHGHFSLIAQVLHFGLQYSCIAFYTSFVSLVKSAYGSSLELESAHYLKVSSCCWCHQVSIEYLLAPHILSYSAPLSVLSAPIPPMPFLQTLTKGPSTPKPPPVRSRIPAAHHSLRLPAVLPSQSTASPRGLEPPCSPPSCKQMMF